MAFDFRYFADALQRAGETFANRYNWEWQRKKEQEYSMQEAKIRQGMQDSSAREMEAINQANRIAAIEKSHQLNLDAETETLRRNSQFEFLLKSPDFVRHYATATMSTNPLERMQLAAQVGVMNKVREGDKLNDADMQIYQTFDPQSQGALSEMIRVNEDRDRGIARDKAYTNLALANAMAAQGRSGKLTIDDLPAMERGITTAAENISKLMNMDEYTRAMMVKQGIISKAPAGIDPMEIESLWKGQLEQMGLLPGFQAIELAIDQERGAMETFEFHRDKILPPNPVNKNIEDYLSKEELGPPESTIPAPTNKAALPEKPKALKGVEKAVGSVWDFLAAPTKKATPDSTIKKAFNLPDTAKVVTLQDDLEFAKRKKAGEFKDGDYIFLDGELFRLIQGKTPGSLVIQKGFGKIKR